MKNIFWHETGPLVQYDGKVIRIEDLNPHVETTWRMSRWEMFAFGFRAIVASVLARAA